MGLLQQASLVITPNAVKAGKLYSAIPNNGTGDLDVVRATSATRVNSAGLIETVGNNIARLDYTNGSCPSILVEPQRTNLLLRSEEFDDVYWTKQSATIIPNQAIAPDGTTTADKLVPNTSNVIHSVARSGQNISGGFYSVFAKADGYEWILFTSHPSSAPASRGAFFNVKNGTIGTKGSGINAKIEDYGKGWYRCSISEGTAPSSIWTVIVTNENGISSFTGNGTDGVLIWGGQNEQGSNHTSYIPTVASTVTRNADVISKTGISDLIGQTEGTVFIDFNNTKIDSVSRYIYAISNGNSTDFNFEALINNSNNLIISSRNNNLTQVSYNYGILSLQKYKIAYSYSENNTRIFINGVLVFVDTICTIPTTDSVKLGMRSNNILQLNDYINKLLLFKTQLTDQECIDLTTL